MWVARSRWPVVANLGEGEALTGDLIGHAGEGFLHVLSIVDVAHGGADLAVEDLGVDTRQTRIDGHRTDGVLLTLVHRYGDDPAGIAFAFDVARIGIHHPEVGIAILQVIAAHEVEIVGDPVGIIDVGRLDEREEVHLRRAHQLAQLALGISAVPDEVDRLDAGLVAFLDHVDQVDTAIRQIDGAEADLGGATAGAAVDFADALKIGLDDALAETAAGLRLDLGFERPLLDLLVPLEHDPVDQVVLANRHHRPGAAARDLDVGEHAARQQVAAGLFGRSGGRAGHVGPDRVGIDALVTLDDDLLRLSRAAQNQPCGRGSD